VTPDGARALGGLVVLVLLAIAAWALTGIVLWITARLFGL